MAGQPQDKTKETGVVPRLSITTNNNNTSESTSLTTFSQATAGADDDDDDDDDGENSVGYDCPEADDDDLPISEQPDQKEITLASIHVPIVRGGRGGRRGAGGGRHNNNSFHHHEFRPIQSHARGGRGGGRSGGRGRRGGGVDGVGGNNNNVKNNSKSSSSSTQTKDGKDFNTNKEDNNELLELQLRALDRSKMMCRLLGRLCLHLTSNPQSEIKALTSIMSPSDLVYLQDLETSTTTD